MDVEMERLKLIDIASEDDYLIAASFRDSSFEGLRLSVAFENTNKREILPSKSLEPHRLSRNGDCSMRKSLAWDSAFFTSSGVLDPEELLMINKGFKKSETHLLPGIEEEFRRSDESNSTINSDGFSLEGLESDLFKDIRASIQMSSKVPNVATRKCASRKGAASKKMDSYRNMVKSVPASRRQSVNIKGSERIAKEHAMHLGAVQRAVRSGESNPSSLKPPKISGRANSISTIPAKRASLGANLFKEENKTAKSITGQHLMVSKKACLGDSCSVMSCATSSKSLSSGSPTDTSGTVSCSSYDWSCTTSDATFSSPLNCLRRKIVPQNLAVSASTLTTPLQYSTRNKKELGSSSHSNCLSSMQKLPSGISPASSTNKKRQQLSSSSSTINQKSDNLKASLDTTPCRGALFDGHATQTSDLESHPHDQSYVEHESKEARFPNQCVKIVAVDTSPASRDASRNLKPSSLRKPLPKIGFFDGEKPMVPTQHGGLEFHSGVQNTLPKANSEMTNPNGIANRTRHGSLTHIDLPSKISREDCLKSKKVGVRRHNRSENGQEFASKVGKKGIQRRSQIREGTESKEHFHVRLSANKIGSNGDGTNHSSQNIKPSKKVCEETNQHRRDNTMHSLHTNEKENIFNFEDQVDGLSRHVGSIDISGDVVLEFKGKKKKANMHPQPGFNNSRNCGPLIFSSFSSKQILEEKKDSSRSLSSPSSLSVPPTVELIPSTRIPLASRDSICIRSGLSELPAELNMENLVEKAPNLQFSEGTKKGDN